MALFQTGDRKKLAIVLVAFLSILTSLISINAYNQRTQRILYDWEGIRHSPTIKGFKKVVMSLERVPEYLKKKRYTLIITVFHEEKSEYKLTVFKLPVYKNTERIILYIGANRFQKGLNGVGFVIEGVPFRVWCGVVKVVEFQ